MSVVCALYIEYPASGVSVLMAFSIYEVVCIACQSRRWFVYASRETGA